MDRRLDPAAREKLRALVTAALHADSRTQRVVPFGSLAGGKSDEFSDIDLMVHLKSGVQDRKFWTDLPEVLHPIGPAVAGWSFQAISSQQYGASFLFDDYPLFWGVDIGCVAERPTDPSDLLVTYRWEQIYKVWVGAAKAVARSRARVQDVRQLVERHERVEEVPGPDSSIRQLGNLLDSIERRKIERGDPYEHLHRRCHELLDALGTS